MILQRLEEMYERYSSLASETLEMKLVEEAVLDDCITKCQEEEKKMVDVDLETAHQQMKIKLLNETLTKRNKEHNKFLSKSKELVLF